MVEQIVAQSPGHAFGREGRLAAAQERKRAFQPDARTLLREMTTRGQNNNMPRKIRQLIADLESAGFVSVPGGKGSHRKFRHPRFRGSVLLSGKDGEDAHQ